MLKNKSHWVIITVDLKEIGFKNLLIVLKNIVKFKNKNYHLCFRIKIFSLSLYTPFRRISFKGDSVLVFLRKTITISPNFFDKIESLKVKEGLEVFYCDSIYICNNNIKNYYSRPIFSEILSNQMDYYGEILIFKCGNLPAQKFKIFTTEKSVQSLLSLAIQLKSISRIPNALYSENLYCKIPNFRRGNVTIPIDKSKAQKFDLIIPTALKSFPGDTVPAVVRLLESINSNLHFKDLIKKAVIALKTEDWIHFLNNFSYLLKKLPIEFCTYDYPFNFSKVINQATDLCKQDVLVFCNDDVTLTSKINFDCFFNHLSNPNVGSVGIKLLNKDGLIIHAGLEYFDGYPRHFLDHFPQEKMKSSHTLCREVSGTTAAFLGIKRSIFNSIGKFDERFPLEYNDVDLMLTLREKGYDNVFCSNIVVQHFESLTRKKGINENYYMKIINNKHGLLPFRDPYLFTPYD